MRADGSAGRLVQQRNGLKPSFEKVIVVAKARRPISRTKDKDAEASANLSDQSPDEATAKSAVDAPAPYPVPELPMKISTFTVPRAERERE